MADEKAWQPTARSRAAAAEHMAAIDANHATFPVCVVCGEHTLRLDEAGCCPRISEPHREHRGEMKGRNRR